MADIKSREKSNPLVSEWIVFLLGSTTNGGDSTCVDSIGADIDTGITAGAVEINDGGAGGSGRVGGATGIALEGGIGA